MHAQTNPQYADIPFRRLGQLDGNAVLIFQADQFITCVVIQKGGYAQLNYIDTSTMSCVRSV